MRILLLGCDRGLLALFFGLRVNGRSAVLSRVLSCTIRDIKLGSICSIIAEMPPRNESSLRVSNGKADVFQKTPTSHLISQLGITEQGSHFYPRFSLQIQKPHKWRELWARH